MSPLSFVLVLTVAVMANASPGEPKKYYNLNEGPALFEQFTKDHNKSYKDDADRQIHYEAFLKNVDKINKMNAREGETAVYGINKFADYTEEERKNMFGFRRN